MLLSQASSPQFNQAVGGPNAGSIVIILLCAGINQAAKDCLQ